MYKRQRLHYASGTDFDIVGLRLSLIEGWRETAPRKWASDNVFYSHRGGLAIWEYEQCLLDVIEATSNQSGAPEPAVGLIAYVPSFQKKMFNNRTIGALSIMAGFFGITSIYRTFPPLFTGNRNAITFHNRQCGSDANVSENVSVT